MIKLENTYIENDKGELRDLYVAECEKQGIKIYDGYGIDWLDLHWVHVRSGEGYLSTRKGKNPYNADYKQITLADLRSQLDTSVEWDGEDYPPIGVDVMVDYCTDGGCDTWMGFHGPSKVMAYHDDHVWIAHHGVHNRIHKLCDVEFKRVETPEELAAKARECELHEISEFMKNDKSPSVVEAIYNYITFKNYRLEE